ncbi:MAG TPA: glycosyltransferase family 2 protein [Sinorhizobium sp.]|nr:glycosyltransferase family 2 protein [Sinorhizobium sp.]
MDVAVIIPFYQAESGILTRALDCIFRQTYRDVRVLIVDDESPLSPTAEVECRSESERARIGILSQRNGGPGSARNAGLDHIAPEVRFIAFLDSDDVWTDGHLQYAVEALERGYDFYFADYTWPSRSSTRFTQTRLTESGRGLDDGGKLFALDADFFEIILTSWPVHISATVIDARVLGSVRFDERLRLSSEDQMYFLQCAGRTSKVCFRNEVMMRLDDGLNIFRRQPVGTLGFSRSRISNAYFHRLVQPLADARSDAAQTKNRDLFRTNVRDFVRSEVKSLIFNRRAHPSLYRSACRVFFARSVPKTCPL